MPAAPETPARPGLLVVDDDALITDALSFALGADYQVYACESRAGAIELLRQLDTAPPLALVDLGLPPTPHAPDQGFQLIAELLAHSPRMRIFVLSGQNDAANARHARALGAWEFVAKPSDPALLKRMLARALEVPAAEDADLAGESQRVGETQRRVARCRVIAATNRDLRREVKKGGFRADLYHRLSVFTLGVPPLRDMESDKLTLLEHFRRLAAVQAGSQPFELDAAATARWQRYDFPGNVRELRNIVIRLVTKYPGQRLSSAELEPELDLEAPALAPGGQSAGAIAEQALRQLE